jgi:hypothetical protein
MCPANSSPHHGSGGGFGTETSLMLRRLIEELVDAKILTDKKKFDLDEEMLFWFMHSTWRKSSQLYYLAMTREGG